MKVHSQYMKEKTLKGFGKRLAQIRKSRGITQIELGEKIGVSQRVIAYYEKDGAQPPGPILIDIASVLNTSTDELLGRKEIKERNSPKKARMLKRLQKIEKLQPADQRAVFKVLDAMVEKNKNTS